MATPLRRINLSLRYGKEAISALTSVRTFAMMTTW
jgi:hypothetical protein